MSPAIEGWYLDPSTGTGLRFWNGDSWTDETAPLPHAPTSAGPVDPPASPPDRSPAGTVLDPELEHTQLTRRELRARRQEEPPDDAPKHLPPMTAPAGITFTEWAASEEQPVDIPAPVARPDDDGFAARRARMLRLSVLLGILAVASSVAVLSAGAV